MNLAKEKLEAYKKSFIINSVQESQLLDAFHAVDSAESSIQLYKAQNDLDKLFRDLKLQPIIHNTDDESKGTGKKMHTVHVEGLYRHYKNGKRYEVIEVGTHTETGEHLVIYHALEDVGKYGSLNVWLRPKEMFEEGIELEDGTVVPRFEYIGYVGAKVADKDEEKTKSSLLLDKAPYPETNIDFENGPTMKLIRKHREQLGKLKEFFEHKK